MLQAMPTAMAHRPITVCAAQSTECAGATACLHSLAFCEMCCVQGRTCEHPDDMVQTFGAAALFDGSYDSLRRANAGAILGRVDPRLVECLPEAWVEFLFSMQAYLRVITLQQILHMGGLAMSAHSWSYNSCMTFRSKPYKAARSGPLTLP